MHPTKVLQGEGPAIDLQNTMRVGSEDELATNPPMRIGESDVGVTNLENICENDCDLRTTNCKAMPSEVKSSQTDGISLSGCKRAQVADDEQTSVQIIYKSLPRKSKKRLEELLHQWSEWHAEQCSLTEGSDEDLESGEETYFPALHVSPDKSCTITFCIDNQVRKKQQTEDVFINNGFEPIYDRDFACPLTSGDGSTNKESGLDIRNASRCFNCDSYSHALKECPKSFNKDAVSKARKLYQLKKNRTAGPRVLTRYYQNTPGGKFDGLKPGCLDPETRKLLSLGEFDPPPWLNRMREMGYPPGYLDLEDDDLPSGITVYADGEENKEGLNASTSEPKRKMSVEFPGINAPIPVNADQSRWAIPSQPAGFNSYGNRSFNYRLNTPAESHVRGHFQHPSWWSGCRSESSPLTPDYARNHQNYQHNYQDYAPEVPLTSNYANKYWDYIKQPSSHYSSYA